MSVKVPRDINQRAKRIIDISTNPERQVSKDPAAVSLGRKGGLKGGPARAAALTPERRSEIARLAAKARWKNKT